MKRRKQEKKTRKQRSLSSKPSSMHRRMLTLLKSRKRVVMRATRKTRRLFSRRLKGESSRLQREYRTKVRTQRKALRRKSLKSLPPRIRGK